MSGPMCARKNCVKHATKQPVLTFAAIIAPNGPRGRAELGMYVCEEHALPDPAEYITDISWQIIVTGMRANGHADPCRRTCRIEFNTLQ